MGFLVWKYPRKEPWRRRCPVQKLISRRRMGYEIAPCVLLMTFLSPLASAQNAGADLSELSLDTLSNIEITSVARKAEKLSKAAAAIFVITQEER